MAQIFGAQYAWHNPREKGNSLLKSCGICPQYAKGPNAIAKTAITPVPSFRAFPNRIWKMDRGPRQYARSRNIKYAGAR